MRDPHPRTGPSWRQVPPLTLFEFSAWRSNNALRANNVRSGTGVVSAAKRSSLRRRFRSRASLERQSYFKTRQWIGGPRGRANGYAFGLSFHIVARTAIVITEQARIEYMTINHAVCSE